ncbi:choice-of-anchor D domain-containing protein [Xanthomarina sp. GH4-25]|uniref:choice-of-anchor D domain-containing protein n=1 Tax=Xanthomarina sp. GH4-25 TaxID=3349335 RepID=UPI003877C4B2
MIKKYSLVLAAFLCFVLSGFAQIINGDLESWTGSTPDGWTTIDSGITTSEETTIIHGGSSSASINVTTGTQGSTDFRQTVSLIIGHNYTASVWVRHTEGGMRARLYVNDNYEVYSDGNITGSWQEITIPFTASSTSAEFGLRFYDMAGFDGAEIVYVDDYTLTDNSVPTGPTVTYDGNGNTGGSVPTDGNNPYTSGDTVTVLGNTGSLTNTCSTFNNWHTTADGVSGTSYSAGNTFTITASTTLYAQWTSTGNTVTFDSNGGTGTMTSQIDCTSANLTNNTYTYTGFTFNSWNTAANGSGTTYADGASYDFSADITLYAQWDVYVGPCLGEESFESGQPAGWSNTGSYFNGGDANSGSNKAGMNDVGDWIQLPDIDNPTSLQYYARLSSSPSSTNSVKIQYYNGISWVDIVEHTATSTSYSLFTADLSSLTALTNVELRIYRSADNRSHYIDDVSVFCGTPTPSPEIDLKQGATSYATTTVAAGSDTYDFGNHLIGTDTDIQFTIENTGDADLTLSAPVISGTGFSLQTGLSLATVPSPSGTSTFTVRFSPNALGGFSGTISIANNDDDENPYVINIVGNGTNSNLSTIVDNTNYSTTTPEFNSNIEYINFIDGSATATGKFIPMKFQIRDGNGSDTDALGTILTDIRFSVEDLSSSNQLNMIKTAILTGTGGAVIATATKVGNELVFSGMSGTSVTADDNDIKNLHLRVSLDETQVIDNTKLVFKVTSATADASGSSFAAADASGAETDTGSNNRNRLNVTADRLRFNIQPTDQNINTNLNTFTVQAEDVHGLIDLDTSNSVTLTTSGTGMTASNPYALTNGVLSISNVQFNSVQGPITLTATTTGLTFDNDDISSPFHITNLPLSNGDYRTNPAFTNAIFFNSTSASGGVLPWQVWNGSAWQDVPHVSGSLNAPENLATKPDRIYVISGSYIDIAGGDAYNNIIVDLPSQNTVIGSYSSTPGVTINPGKTFNLISGIFDLGGVFDLEANASLRIRTGAEIDISSSSFEFLRAATSTWEVENEAFVFINSYIPNAWTGTEIFHEESYFEVTDWDENNDEHLFQSNEISPFTFSGYNGLFGNLYLTFTSLNNNWNDVLPIGTYNLTHGDFEVSNNSGENINLIFGGSVNVTIGNNMTISGDDNVQFQSGAGTSSLTVKNNFIKNNNNEFSLHAHTSDTATLNVDGNLIINDGFFYMTKTSAGAATSVINLKGNLTLVSGAYLTNSNSSGYTNDSFNFNGDGSIQTIDAVVHNSNDFMRLRFFVKPSAYVQFINQDVRLGTNSVFTVEDNGTLDFGFNGVTALNLTIAGSNTGSVFSSEQGSTLIITSPNGINQSGYTGNVQTLPSGRTFNQTATFYYVGKENQVTGNALTTGSTEKLVYVNLLDNTTTLSLTNDIGISDDITLDPLGGKLEIQQGTVIGSNSGDFYGSGRLVMTDGEYRISTITADPLADFLPRLGSTIGNPGLGGYSNYSLTGGIVHLNGTGLDNTQILSGVPNYVNLSFSGSNTLAELPPLPPGIPTYKGISSGTNVSNNITIFEDAIVDIKNWSLGGPGTNLIMADQSRFIMAGASSTKPDAASPGTYSLGANTTIEFNNNIGGLQNIRLTGPVPSYANIVVSGSNVGTNVPGTGANSFLQFQAGGSFTVTPTGTFKQSNIAGFSGGTNTALHNNNNPTITLYDGSNIEYTGADQIITALTTNALPTNDYYANLTISGTGTKTLGHTTDVFVGEDLHVNSSRLLVDENEAITVDESVNVNASATFDILDSGSLVQVNDGSVNTGNISMLRDANIKRLDYVYWSSPISSYNVNSISPGSPTNRIYKWDPVYSNTNGTLGNWVPAAGETMQEGVGYIVRGPDTYTDTAANYTATFNNGTPFNGVVPVTVQRGNLTGEDDQWNLVGNPYPSAVDVFAFLDHPANAVLDGFVNFWTHGDNPSTSVTSPYYDNFGSNYTATDYISYNKTGAGNAPGNISIAAGQSFMVNLSDTSPLNSHQIEFNNSMRNKAYDNSQFYRTTQSENASVERHRIWLDLVSETQGTNRILVGYIEDATMERDRLYDAITSVTSEQQLYTLIDETPFVIQGRALPFNDTDVVPLGVNIVAQGDYHIAIAFIDGLFETDNQFIYLKDNELGFIHNLSEAPYSFTSEVGEFNDRFEIVFRDSFLSINEEELSGSNVSIIELQNGDVQFTVPSQFEIKSVEIIDMLGRTIYNLKGNSSSETYNLSNLSQATYVAKITLSNGQVISKKAVKRK